MNDKNPKEFARHAQYMLFGEYKNLKSNLRKVLKESNLPDFFKSETLFELVEEIREEN